MTNPAEPGNHILADAVAMAGGVLQPVVGQVTLQDGRCLAYRQ